MGVKLTTENVIHEYYYGHLDLKTSDIITTSFGMANVIACPFSGFVFDLLTRLWNVWIMQTLGGAFCVWLGQAKSLSLSIFAIVYFSPCAQATCVAVFSVVPFVARRSLGIMNEMTGVGGNFGVGLT